MYENEEIIPEGVGDGVGAEVGDCELFVTVARPVHEPLEQLPRMVYCVEHDRSLLTRSEI